MAELTPEERIASGKEWFAQHRADYIRTRGAVGHIISLEHDGGRPFVTHCLLRTIGRKTGKAYVNPMFYAVYGGEIVVVASKSGVDEDPHWSRNLRAAPEAQVQIAGQAFRVATRVAEGEERQKIWEYVLTNHPPFARYQGWTERVFPLHVLRGCLENRRRDSVLA